MTSSSIISLFEMAHKIIHIINTHTWTVDQQTIDHFNKKFAKGGYSTLLNCQAELLEYSLERRGLLNPTETYRNDGIFPFWPEMKPDFKRKPGYSENLSISKWEDKETSYNMNDLTHFIGFSQNIVSLLEIGQKHTFRMVTFIPFTEANKSKVKKIKNGNVFYIVPVKKLKNNVL